MNKQLVKNEKKYWNFIRSLRNDSRVKEGFVEQQHITKNQHEKRKDPSNRNLF